MKAGLTLVGVTVDSLLNDPIAQAALVDATVTAAGGSAQVKITNITSVDQPSVAFAEKYIWTSGRRLTAGVSVTMQIIQRIEALGYSPEFASAAFTAIVSSIDSSVASGAFTQTLQDAAAASGSDVFSDVAVDGSIDASPPAFDYEVTAAPTTAPPTLSPTAIPTVASGGNTGKKKVDAGVIAGSVVGAVAGVVLLLVIVYCIVVCFRKPKEGNNLPVDEMQKNTTQMPTLVEPFNAPNPATTTLVRSEQTDFGYESALQDGDVRPAEEGQNEDPLTVKNAWFQGGAI